MQYAVCSHGNQTVLGEAYAYGDVDIEGDVEALFPLTTFLHRPNLSPVPQIRLGTLGDAEKSHTTHGADGSEASGAPAFQGAQRQAVTYHYNTSPTIV